MVVSPVVGDIAIAGVPRVGSAHRDVNHAPSDRRSAYSLQIDGVQRHNTERDHGKITGHRDPGVARTGGAASQQQIFFTGNRQASPRREKPAGVNRRVVFG